MANAGITRVGVIGAGTMGPGIAQTFAQYGCEVQLYSRKQETLDRAIDVIKSSLSLFTDMSMLEEEQAGATLERIHATRSLEKAGRDAQLIVETVAENKDVKKDILSQLNVICPTDTIFTSNTSYLNIFEVAPRPTSTVIAHWFAPPQIMPLVEVVPGPETSEKVLETVVDLLKNVGKTPVKLNSFVPGFVINRLLMSLGREAFYLLDKGHISPENLDLAVKASLAPRMCLLGVIQRYDFTGLNLSAGNLQNPQFEDAPVDRRPKTLFDRVEAGHLGVKSGKGFYDYSGRDLVDILRERDRQLLRILSATKFCLEEHPSV